MSRKGCVSCFVCFAGVIAIAEINEALNSGDVEKTLAALLLPTAKLQGVNPDTAKHYHDVLLHTKELVCKVAQYPQSCQKNILVQLTVLLGDENLAFCTLSEHTLL